MSNSFSSFFVSHHSSLSLFSLSFGKESGPSFLPSFLLRFRNSVLSSHTAAGGGWERTQLLYIRKWEEEERKRGGGGGGRGHFAFHPRLGARGGIGRAGRKIPDIPQASERAKLVS